MTSLTVLDTKSFNARARDALVLSMFESLNQGESFLVLTDPGGEDLCRQLDQLSGMNLGWEYEDRGNREWKLRIRKLTESEARQKKSGGCCGSCGG